MASVGYQVNSEQPSTGLMHPFKSARRLTYSPVVGAPYVTGRYIDFTTRKDMLIRILRGKEPIRVKAALKSRPRVFRRVYLQILCVLHRHLNYHVQPHLPAERTEFSVRYNAGALGEHGNPG